MKIKRTLFILMYFSFLVAACSKNTPTVNQLFSTQAEPTSEVTQLPVEATPALFPTDLVGKPVSEPAGEPSGAAYPELSDAQGAVTVFVTPVNLDPRSEWIEFDVALDTHSVDLSMDLAVLATLSTDTGRSVQAVQWDAPRGGHHVQGTLSFPNQMDGQPLLEGAQTLNLTIIDLDVPERVLTWEIRQ